MTMRISVIVPSFRRPVHLSRCLAALQRQQRAPDEVVVVSRLGDDETDDVLRPHVGGPLPLRVIRVAQPGFVVALNAGLEGATGDILTFTDDDAAAWPDWLLRIEAHFEADARLGGLGGRDWMYYGDRLQDGAATRVGRLQWFGRLVGNHHLGVGPPREVDVLKGVNMSYRRAAVDGLRFDGRLRGVNMQMHTELAFSFAVRRAGWRLVYDPAVAVDHVLAPRLDVDQRDVFHPLAMSNAVHNETLSLLEHLPTVRRWMFLGWALAVGSWASPGLAQWGRMLLRREPSAGRRLLASLKGRREAWGTFRRRA